MSVNVRQEETVDVVLIQVYMNMGSHKRKRRLHGSFSLPHRLLFIHSFPVTRSGSRASPVSANMSRTSLMDWNRPLRRGSYQTWYVPPLSKVLAICQERPSVYVPLLFKVRSPNMWLDPTEWYPHEPLLSFKDPTFIPPCSTVMTFPATRQCSRSLTLKISTMNFDVELLCKVVWELVKSNS